MNIAVIETTNKVTIMRFYNEMVNGGRLEVSEALFADDFKVDHPHENESLVGPEGVREIVSNIQNGFPDFHIQLTELIAEDMTVTAHFRASGSNIGEFLGLAPTRKRISVNCIAKFELGDGKIINAWIHCDDLGIKLKPGLLPIVAELIA
ncbi:MAG: ester cyclase [Bacteroidetes bacterium]|nr:ester cyclase [Bacteroidota bacterium]